MQLTFNGTVDIRRKNGRKTSSRIPKLRSLSKALWHPIFVSVKSISISLDHNITVSCKNDILNYVSWNKVILGDAIFFSVSCKYTSRTSITYRSSEYGIECLSLKMWFSIEGEREREEEDSMPSVRRWQNLILLGSLSLADGDSKTPSLLFRCPFSFCQ